MNLQDAGAGASGPTQAAEPASIGIVSGRYRLEEQRARFVWKSYLRTTGTLGQRWLRRKARQDWLEHPVQPGVDVVSFWLDQTIGGGGTGVGFALFCNGSEALRFDCFGGRLGHYHITPFTPWKVRIRRLEFLGQTVHEQIDEALFHIIRNHRFFLQLNPLGRLRRVHIDGPALERACESARASAMGYLASAPVLRPLAEGHVPSDAISPKNLIDD